MTGENTRPAWVSAFSMTFGLRLLGAGAAFATTILIARLCGQKVLAQLFVLLAVIDVSAGLAGPALDATLVRFASPRIRPGHDSSLPYFQRMFRVKLIVACALVCLGAIAAWPVREWLLREPEGGAISTGAVALAFVGGAAMTLLGFVQSYYQSHQRFGRYASVEFANTCLRLAAVILLVFVSKPAVGALLAVYVLSPTLVAVVGGAGLPRAAISLRAAAPVSLREPFRFAQWVMAAAVFTTLAQRADLFLLKHEQIPEVQLGLYVAALGIMRLGDLAIMTLFSVLLPRASQLRSSHEMKAFLRRFHLPALLVLLLALPLAPLTGPVVRLCYGAEFAGAGKFLAILLLGSLATLGGAPAGAAIYGMGRSHLIAIFEAVKLAALLLGGLWAVPRYGVAGMAWTLAVVRATIAVATYGAAHGAASRYNAEQGHAAIPNTETNGGEGEE